MANPKQNPVAGKTVERKFWWMVAGDVFFTVPEDAQLAGQQQAASMNSIMSTQGPEINSKALGRAQAGLIQSLHDTSPEVKFNILDVKFTNISGLGHMTDEEFFGKQTVEDVPPAGL